MQAVVGLGASPGISNLLAMRVVGELDEVHVLHTLLNAVDDFAVFGEGPKSFHGAATVHWMEQLHGRVPAVEEGRLGPTRPLERLHLPSLGPVETHAVGHPEPMRLHRRFPRLHRSRNAMIGNRRLFALLRSLSARMDEGLPPEDAARGCHEEVAGLVDLRPAAGSDGRPLPSLMAYAESVRDGRPRRAVAWCMSLPPGGTAGVTAAPFSLAVPLRGGGWSPEPSVRAPEAAVHGATFFDLLAPLCKPAMNGAELVRVAAGPAP